MKKIIDVAEVSKTFGKGTNINKVLDNCSLYVNEGEFVSLMGASGSGTFSAAVVLHAARKARARAEISGRTNIPHRPCERAEKGPSEKWSFTGVMENSPEV